MQHNIICLARLQIKLIFSLLTRDASTYLRALFRARFWRCQSGLRQLLVLDYTVEFVSPFHVCSYPWNLEKIVHGFGHVEAFVIVCIRVPDDPESAILQPSSGFCYCVFVHKSDMWKSNKDEYVCSFGSPYRRSETISIMYLFISQIVLSRNQSYFVWFFSADPMQQRWHLLFYNKSYWLI